MITYRTRMFFFSLCALALIGQPVAWADDLDEIRFGEAALMYAAGSIRLSTSQDGFVNVITGDNQTIGDRMQLGQRDTLYLKLKHPGDAAVGDLFTVFKRTRKVFHPATGEYMGYLINRLAIVQVVQADKVLTTAHVVRAYGAISPGDPVVRFALPVEPQPASDHSVMDADTAGMIVELQSDMVMTLVAQRNVVYVDRGREDGLRVGDQMDVIRSGGGLPPRVVGEIRILSTEDRSATALITKSTARILRGDRFRVKIQAPEPVPVSRPAQEQPQKLLEPSMATESVPKTSITHTVSREARITLSELMKQLRYESGEATIRPEGFQVLNELIEYLKGAPADQLIRVEGHADNMEIGPSLMSRYPTNWDLSKARARGVLHYLIEKGGIDSARISSVGYGDTKPILSNATEQGRQRNRRVDIVLYLPESDNGTSGQTMKSPMPHDEYKIGGLGATSRKSAVSSIDNAAPAAPPRSALPEAPPISLDPVPAPAMSDESAIEPTVDPPIVPQ